MSFFLQKILIFNRAPFNNIGLDFSEGEISVLSAINGGGKTTIISHIVDAWHEMTKKAFYNEYADKPDKYYRVSSPLYSINSSIPSLFYSRFIFDGKSIDYVDLRGPCAEEDYVSITKSLTSVIPFSSLKSDLQKRRAVKKCSIDKEEELSDIFSKNISTSFPSFRFETPGYMNTPYDIELDFAVKGYYSGYLNNPIEVRSSLPNIANWIMDVILDSTLYPERVQNNTCFTNINLIFENLLNPKFHKLVRVGLGDRHSSAQRICVGECDKDKNWISTLYPSIFNMSSGEHALICIFIELIRQLDRIRAGETLTNASGIVLIDEIDKHLHIKIQKEVLPSLLNLFPNIQFIISTHSPFISMGLAEQAQKRTKIIALDQGGFSSSIETDELYQEVYGLMVNENFRYKERYEQIVNASKPYQLYIEDTFAQIYKIAWLKLKEINFTKNNIDEKFNVNSPFEIFEDNSCTGIAGLLNAQSVKNHKNKKIIGLFDYDWEGSERFYNLKNGFAKDAILGTLSSGYYKQKHKSKHPYMYGLLLPVPERLYPLIASQGNWKADCKFANYIEIETLLPESFLSLHKNDYSEEFFSTFRYYKAKDKKKPNLWKSLITEPKEIFEDFKPLFFQIYELFNLPDNPFQI